uniref:Ycf54 n=1 Tax=Polysiphonia infestans TaxID=2006978 RepID=A0A1Z1ME34_9FLOR|nr:hypothetical protein [Polysiphonia infestans]ARW64280.1 hypothetical protein [Polysiphonia infestans]
MYNYHFAIASQSFFLDQEPLEEILRERTNYYKNFNQEIDFWFILNPSFSDSLGNLLNVPDNKLNKSSAAIVSLDKQFIEWLKLRIVFVNTGSFESKLIFIPNLL